MVNDKDQDKDNNSCTSSQSQLFYTPKATRSFENLVLLRLYPTGNWYGAIAVGA